MIDELAGHFLEAASGIPGLGRFEAAAEAVNLFKLVVRHRVEVAEQDSRPSAAGRMAEPVLPEQRLHLRRPLARQQAEMRVDHLQRPRPVAEPHRGPERAAWLEERWAAPRSGSDPAFTRRSGRALRIAAP
jgi:hypothetical protein